MLAVTMSDFDQSQTLDSTPSPFTRDFIGLCIGILSVVLVILTVAICKWSRCLCLKRSNDNNDQNEVFSSILQQNTSTSRPQSRRHQNQNQNQHQYQQRSSSCDHRPGSIYQHVNDSRNDLILPSQPINNGYRLNDVKVPRVTITTLAVQPSQQLVPRLSISPQVSGSSITRSTYSLKQ